MNKTYIYERIIYYFQIVLKKLGPDSGVLMIRIRIEIFGWIRVQ